jgi:hypothetical protein
VVEVADGSRIRLTRDLGERPDRQQSLLVEAPGEQVVRPVPEPTKPTRTIRTM